MPRLPPEHYLSPEDLKLLAAVEKRLRELHAERAPLAEKLKARQITGEEMAEIKRLNVEIDGATKEHHALLEKNPMLPKNLVT